jgi:radical SAM superfamily enzyme YgiQ (UPF0313 family)
MERNAPLKILLGDLNYINRHSRVYVPLNLGYIASYTTSEFGSDVDISLYNDPDQFLENAKNEKPDIVGLAFRGWNTSLNKAVVRQLRERYGKNLVIVWGGPSIDSDPEEQARLFTRFPEVDAYTVNEGDLGFAEIVRRTLADSTGLWDTPIDGAIFHKEDKVVAGAPVGLTMDLATLKSPYLTGMLDPFIEKGDLPVLQTSRFCPYGCTFCVSGKNTGKLRAFPLELVHDELKYLSEKYSDRPHQPLYLADENFGILARDIEVAKYVREFSEGIGYPSSFFFYNDKRFTEKSKELLESLGPLAALTLSLQSDNPETLKAIKRKNLTKEEIAEAIQWGAERGLSATTELIFGLPFETRSSFTKILSNVIDAGFGSVTCHNLIVLDATELNRRKYREESNMQTKFRPMETSYGYVGDEFIAESEEIVTSTDYFDFDDYLVARSLSLLCYAVFTCNFYKWFFQFIRHSGIPIIEFFEALMAPDPNEAWPDSYIKFVSDFQEAAEGELFETQEQLQDYLQEVYAQNGNKVAKPPRHNIAFSARLIYLEDEWIDTVLMKLLRRFNPKMDAAFEETAQFLLELCNQERINVLDPEETFTMETKLDLFSWEKSAFLETLKQTQPKNIRFTADEDALKQFRSFKAENTELAPLDYFWKLVEYILPRSKLNYKLSLDS